jgi:Zn-finger nucleic acid-binding protein
MRVLGENPEGITCPQCNIVLNMAVFDDFYQGYQCSNCQGLLFNRTTFREAIDNARSKIKTPPDPIRGFDSLELERKTFCPICEQPMETFQYLGPGNIVIDTCHQDDLIWLDYGEIQKVLNAPGRDRGVPRKKPSKKEEERGEQQMKKNPLEKMLLEIVETLFSD